MSWVNFSSQLRRSGRCSCSCCSEPFGEGSWRAEDAAGVGVASSAAFAVASAGAIAMAIWAFGVLSLFQILRDGIRACAVKKHRGRKPKSK